MGQFGHELRRERESRGIPLGNITGVTKISERHLLALEEERFDALPGGVLSKGMVRGYAKAVGLDEDAWVRRYLSAYYQSGQIKDDDVAWIEFAENVGRARKVDDPGTSQKMRWVGVALLLTLLALCSWYVARYLSDRAVSCYRPVPPATLVEEVLPGVPGVSTHGSGEFYPSPGRPKNLHPGRMPGCEVHCTIWRNTCGETLFAQAEGRIRLKRPTARLARQAGRYA